MWRCPDYGGVLISEGVVLCTGFNGVGLGPEDVSLLERCPLLGPSDNDRKTGREREREGVREGKIEGEGERVREREKNGGEFKDKIKRVVVHVIKLECVLPGLSLK